MQFSKKIFGYNQEQVNLYISKLVAEYEKKIQSIQLEYEELTRVNTQLKAELDKAQSANSIYQKAEKAVAEAFIQAQLEATMIKDEARQKAAKIAEAAEQQVAEKKRELAELQESYILAQKDFELLLNKYRSVVSDLGRRQALAKDERDFQTASASDISKSNASPAAVNKPAITGVAGTDGERPGVLRSEKASGAENDLPFAFIEPE